MRACVRAWVRACVCEAVLSVRRSVQPSFGGVRGVPAAESLDGSIPYVQLLYCTTLVLIGTKESTLEVDTM